MELNQKTRVLIAGCGYVGTKLAHLFLDQNVKVDAMVKTSGSLDKLAKQGISVFSHDLDVISGMKMQSLYTIIYYMVPPQKEGVEDRRIRVFLESIIEKPGRIVLFSTTGVYGDSHGAWVDERTVPSPIADRAKRRLDAEQSLIAWCREHEVEYTILRIPGIYGPGKIPLDRVKSGAPILRLEESPWSNRIHVDDLLQVCMASLRSEAKNQVFNVSDGMPSSMSDYFLKIAEVFQLASPEQITAQQASKVFSRDMLSYLGESRKISNQKMLEVLDIQLEYPDLYSGLNQCRRELGC